MNQTPVTIITPCYNEGATVIKFLENLENVLASLTLPFYVVVVNDCSDDDTPDLLRQFRFRTRQLTLKLINLKVNVGHQEAIYQGLLFARDLNSQYFIVMDADGEDSPAVIPALLDQSQADIVHVVRGKRNESVLFRVCYECYKIMFRLFTGKQMNYGNFCLINRPVLEQAVRSTFSHFAAFLAKQRCTKQYIVAQKEIRLGGHSKMGFGALMHHAFKSFVEYGVDHAPLVRFQNHHPKTPIYEISSGRNTEEAL